MKIHTDEAHHGTWARGIACGLAAASVLLLLAPAARALDDVPDYKFLIHCAIPKDGLGPGAGAVPEGTIRNTFETTIETYWKEVSYHEAGPDGFAINGFYPDTKTYGYVFLPWAAQAPAGGRPDAWASASSLPPAGRPVSFSGEDNLEGIPGPAGLDPDGTGQLCGGTGPLVDGYWTPGERFQDLNGNGRWDGVIFEETPGEDWWDTDNTVDPRWRGTAGDPNGLAGPDGRGELYADYNGNTIAVGTNVVQVGFDASVQIYLASGESNRVITISEFDLLPLNGVSSNNGDFAHTHNISPGGPDAVGDIPRDGIFNYQRNPLTFDPMVYRATLSYNPTLLFTVTYPRLVATNGTVYTGTQASADGATVQTVQVPVYQATELWGDVDPLGEPGVRMGAAATWQSGTTTDLDAEPFEDFISYWVPFAGGDQQGRWVCEVIGIADAPNADQADNPAGWGVRITRADYDKYIRDNYPGNAEELIARAGNGVYDGPDNWQDRISNKMQIRGYVGDQGGTAPPYPLTPAPSTWDPHGWYPGGWQSWWTNVFASAPPATFGSPYNGGSWFPGGGIPRCQAITPSGTTADAAGWIPALQNTWGYDGPREFQDLPSSIYHLGNDDGRGDYAANPYPGGGDLRLGEVTSPANEQNYGADLGNADPNTATPFSAGDGTIPCGGPLAYGGASQYTFDSLNVLSLEVATWRTDGEALTGPVAPPVSRGSGTTIIKYGGDHRDVTLDGLIDQGETVPASSHAYFIDDRPPTGAGVDTSPDGGFTSRCLYPFNWDRYAEDCVEAQDYLENYATAVRYTPGTVDETIDGGHADAHPHEGGETVATITPGVAGLSLPNVVGRGIGMTHTQFVPGDSVWIDGNNDNIYNRDEALSDPAGTLTNGTPGVTLSNAYYQAATGTTNFERSTDSVWIDSTANGAFDSETVLYDSGLLRAGLTGKLVTWMPGMFVRYHHRGAGPDTGYERGDDVWVETAATNAVAGAYDPSDILITSWSGVTNGLAASVNVLLDAVYYPRRAAGQPDTGYRRGDDLWLDDVTPNSQFDAEVLVSVATRYIYGWDDARALTNGTAGLALTNALTRNLGGGAGFDRGVDEAWVSHTGTNVFGSETQIAGPELANGAGAQYSIPNALFHDRNSNLAYDAGEEGVWDERSGDSEYGDAGTSNVRLPTYFVAVHNGIGVGVDLAGNTTQVYHSDEQTPLSGFIQVVPVGAWGTLSHEQGHDIMGWPDLYDYDIFDGGYFNTPIGNFDLMAGGGFVHGIPDLKVSAGWTGATHINAIFPPNSGAFAVYMKPVEYHKDQYYYFTNPGNPGEKFWIWYQSGVQANAYQNFAGPGAQGVHIEHVDLGADGGALPPQQRMNNHFTYHIVQADGLYQMEDGINAGEPADVFPGTTNNRLFTEDTIPWARWWDQSASGLRIINIQLPSTPTGPALVYFDYFDPTSGWYPPSGGIDADNDGIPDAWEVHYFGSITVVSGSSDYDGDGLMDYGEYKAGTDPKERSSVLRIYDTVEDNGDQIVLSWQSVDGKSYAVQGSTNLMAGFGIDIASGISATPPDNVYTVTVDRASSPSWYVRVVAED